MCIMQREHHTINPCCISVARANIDFCSVTDGNKGCSLHTEKPSYVSTIPISSKDSNSAPRLG
jgi:hypothetical protein